MGTSELNAGNFRAGESSASDFFFFLFFFFTYSPFLFSLSLGPIQTTPEKFENATFFQRLGLTSTLIRHENGDFRNAVQIGRN